MGLPRRPGRACFSCRAQRLGCDAAAHVRRLTSLGAGRAARHDGDHAGLPTSVLCDALLPGLAIAVRWSRSIT